MGDLLVYATPQYFVMLRTRFGGLTPMLDIEEKVGVFSTIREALTAAKECPLAQANGFEIYNRNDAFTQC